MEEEILEFIKRRFPQDSNWTTGNCYFFAKILNIRFPIGEIYYDVIYGHFVCQINNKFYDYNGEFLVEDSYLVKWKDFPKYDMSQYSRIVTECIN